MFLPPPEDTVQEIYELAKDSMQEKKYKTAIKYYTKIKDNYPFSPYALEAELAVGDAYFLLEQYSEASEAYQEFESLHPRHESIPYVLYQIGLSEFKTFYSIDRPTTMVGKALEYFKRVQESYPESEYAIKAAQQITECRKIMAEHEMFVGDMYWQMKKYGSARDRYLYIINNYQDITELKDHAQKKAEAAYYMEKEQQGESDRRKVHGNWRDYFKWL